MARVPNYKLDGYFARREPVENYNGTIRAYYDAHGNYTVQHWNTVIGNVSSRSGMVRFETSYISQTTAKLLGRFLRSQDSGWVDAWIENSLLGGYIDAKRARQLRRQAR